MTAEPAEGEMPRRLPRVLVLGHRCAGKTMLVKALTTSWATAWSKPKDPLYVETTTIRFRLVDLGGGHEVQRERSAKIKLKIKKTCFEN